MIGSGPSSDEMWYVDGPASGVLIVSSNTNQSSQSSGNYVVYKENKN